MKLLPLLLLAGVLGSCSADAETFDPRDQRSPLHLVRSIAVPNVRGRIDHMALDAQGNHLFIAEYGNGSVDEVDLNSGAVVGRISGLHEPQGVAWLPNQQEIAVTSADGRLNFYRGSDRHQVAVVRLGDDADNVRVDARNGDLIVGYGSGALAVIDPATHQMIRELPLSAHPEAFELLGSRVFVNVPDAHQIVIGDLDQGRVSAALSTGTHFGNFPMATDASGSRVALAYRVPATLSVMDPHSGEGIFSAGTCGDADDLYFHGDELVVVCGSGAIELVDSRGAHRKITVTTYPGARTGLLDPTGKRFFVAVPAGKAPAAIWELSFR